ncbi:MAG: hypothetical protein ACFHU9_02745 [Fluviicola sp.]
MTKRYAILAFLVVALALFFGLHYANIGVNQGGTAHGQQGANLAMAEGFVDNGLDFWHPQTKALNYRNGDFNLYKTSATGITAAHFPIHAYIPAAIHSYTNWQLSKVMQVYNILWGFVGLFFLYLLTLRITNHIGKSLFVVVFVGTAPIFAFYQSNFLPEIPAFAAVLAGIYFMYRWRSEHKERFAWFGMGWLLFACLPSPDLSFYLGAGIYLIYWNMPKKKNFYFQPVVIALIFFVGLLITEAIFNSLRSDYGSQFPGWLQDWVYDQSVWNSIFGSWKLHYFTTFQSVFIAIILILVMAFLVKVKKLKSIRLNAYLISIFAILPLVRAITSPYQSINSDVFFLKFLLVPCIFGLIVLVDQFKLSVLERKPKLSGIGFILLLFIMIGEGNWTQNVRKELNRTSAGSNLAYTFRGGNELLLKHGVNQGDPLSVVVPNNWGIGQEVLGHLHHKGYIRETPNGEELLAKIPKGHYVVCHLDEMPFLYDHFRTNVKELGNNGNIVLLKALD